MALEKEFLALEVEAKAKKKKLQEKASKKCFSNARFVERELKKRGVEVKKPFYDFSREELVDLVEELVVAKNAKNSEDDGDFELDYDG